MPAGISGHISTDIHHSIEKNGWSDREKQTGELDQPASVKGAIK